MADRHGCREETEGELWAPATQQSVARAANFVYSEVAACSWGVRHFCQFEYAVGSGYIWIYGAAVCGLAEAAAGCVSVDLRTTL